jgi:hypothetical protein
MSTPSLWNVFGEFEPLGRNLHAVAFANALCHGFAHDRVFDAVAERPHLLEKNAKCATSPSAIARTASPIAALSPRYRLPLRA